MSDSDSDSGRDTNGDKSPMSSLIAEGAMEVTFGRVWRGAFWALNRSLSRCASLGLEVFIHTHFGIRYIRVPVLMINLKVMAVFFYLAMRANHDLTLFVVYVVLFLIAAITQIVISQVLNWCPIRWHSKYSGRPWPCWFHLPVSEWVIKAFLEPVIGLLTAFAIWQLSTEAMLAAYLVVASIAAGLKSVIERGAMWEYIIEANDSRLDAQAISEETKATRDPARANGSAFAGWAYAALSRGVKPSALRPPRKLRGLKGDGLAQPVTRDNIAQTDSTRAPRPQRGNGSSQSRSGQSAGQSETPTGAAKPPTPSRSPAQRPGPSPSPDSRPPQAKDPRTP